MINLDDVQGVLGRDVVGKGGERIGKAGQVYLDDSSGQPEWVTVSTGLFGTKESFIPLADATLTGDDVVVPYDKTMVKGAPNVDPDAGHLSETEEASLFEYYGVSYGGGTTYDSTTDDSTTDVDSTKGRYAADRDATVGHDTSGPETDDAMTRSEEQVRAGTQTVESGRARLRKWVETEEVNVTVPVTREKARLETEPITDANRGAALSGGDLTEEEHEVVLTEERPVVQKETVPVERVRLTKDVEQAQETVSEEVRKERIAADGDLADGDADLTDRR